MRPLRVCIDARIESGLYGGTEQVVIALAAALSKLSDGEEEYVFLTSRGKDEWIRPYLRGPCRAMVLGKPPLSSGWRYRLQRLLEGRVPLVPRVVIAPEPVKDVMHSDGTIEAAGVDLIHFLNQMAFLTEVPSIYHPHDLQHLHLPELFTTRDMELRSLWYRSFSEQASLVAIMTRWGRQDLIDQLEIPPEKIAIVPWGSVLSEYPEPSEADRVRVRAELGLPESFILYPAQTWPHKNHERLLEALALIKNRHGVSIPLVCTGKRNERFQPRLDAMVRELGLEDSTSFVGFVSPLQLRCLYETARALVFPSRFEGWGMPIGEAFASGLPVASSSATCLPDLVDGAGLLFDPNVVEQIADSVWRLWTDPELRTRLAERGRQRSKLFSFDRAARLFRAHYRQIGGRPLTAEDRELLTAPPPA